MVAREKIGIIIAMCAVGISVAVCISFLAAFAFQIGNCHTHFGKSVCGDDDKAFHIIRDDILRSAEVEGSLP